VGGDEWGPLLMKNHEKRGGAKNRKDWAWGFPATNLYDKSFRGFKPERRSFYSGCKKEVGRVVPKLRNFWNQPELSTRVAPLGQRGGTAAATRGINVAGGKPTEGFGSRVALVRSHQSGRTGPKETHGAKSRVKGEVGSGVGKTNTYSTRCTSLLDESAKKTNTASTA